MSTCLPRFSSPGVRAAAARGVPILHSDLEEVFPTNLVFPNTELEGGKGVGSSIVTVPKTFESCIPVTHMFLEGGGISSGGGRTGCRNCLKRLVICMSRSLFHAPTVPTGSRAARKYDTLLLRGNVRIISIMGVPKAFDTV